MAQVAFLESYARLRQHGVFTHLEHFVFSPNVSKQDADQLISEVHALLEADEAVLDAMMAMSEPSFMAYRHASAQMHALGYRCCQSRLESRQQKAAAQEQ